MMRMKTTMVLCMALCMGNTVSAAEVNISERGRTVTVTDKLNNPEEAMLIVTRSGKSVMDNDSIYAIKRTTPDPDGIFKWVFDMPEEKNGEASDGEYDLYIKQNGEEIVSDKMVYMNLANRTEFINKVKGIKSASELKDFADNAENYTGLCVLGFNIDFYNTLGNSKKDVAGMVCEYIGDFSECDADKIASAFNIASAVAGIDESNVHEVLENLNFSFDNKFYNDITDEKLGSWINEYMCSEAIDSVEEFEKAYERANILYVINNTKVDYIKKVLDEYSKMLGIDDSDEYEEYLDLSKSERNTADSMIVKKLSKSPVKSVNSLLDLIGETAGSSKKKSDKGTGGGGGGSSKTSGVAVSVPSVETKEETDDKPSGEIKFSDIAGAEWAAEAITEMAKAGIVSGDENGNFRPYDTVTRGEFVKMLVIACGKCNENSKCSFEDTKPGDWHYKYIASAFESKLVTGISEKEFGVNSLLTRQDMALLCKRASGNLLAKRDKILFADDSEISDYAKEAVYELYMAEGISGMGDGTFAPLETATRAQSAVIIYNLFIR